MFNASAGFEASPVARSASPPILIVPGLNNSGPAHWQTYWELALPNAERVEQTDWDRPTLGEWMESLVDAVRRRPGAVIVAHSLGCALVAHLASLRGARGVAGALLVAPADVDGDGPAGRLLQGFGPMPLQPLPFPSMLVASRNDPYMGFAQAEQLAASWGAALADAGHAGHINVDSGHGPWPEGRRLLAEVLDRVAARATAAR